jgi:hypothetical protein
MFRYDGKTLRSVTSAALAGSLLLFLSACLREDENSPVIFESDEAVVLAPLTIPAFKLPPAGSAIANRLELISFDVTASSDAFGRATGPFGYGWRDTGPWYRLNGAERNSTNDLRLPALGGTGTEIVFVPGFGFDPTTGCWFGPPATFSGIPSGWDFWCWLDGLQPNTDYTAVLVRYYVDVRGELDTIEMLLNGTVTQPDSLIPLDGSPGGYPEELYDFDPARPTYTTGVTGNQNPFVMGYQTSDGTGFAVIDCLVGSGGFWADDFPNDPSEAPLGPNTFESFSLPRYNYVEIYEGRGTNANPIPPGPPVLRFQVGVDIDASGNPIPNSFGPAPTVGLDPFQLAEADFAESRPDSIIFRLDNLAKLAGPAAYQVFALLDDGSVSSALDFVYMNVKEMETGDSVITGPTQTSSFSGGSYTHVLTVEHPDNATHLFLTIQEQPGGSPSAAQLLWMKGGIQPQGVQKTKDFDVTFGTFALSDPTQQRLWSISGTGTGGLFGVEFRAEYEHLPRPPIGYQYVGYLVSDSLPPVRLPDETFTSPPREYAVLTDADVDLTISDVVQPGEILRAMTRFCLEPATPVSGPPCQGPFDIGPYDLFVLALAPKAADPTLVVPTRVLEGTLPAR